MTASSSLTPSLLSAFQLGLQAPGLGPLVPFSAASRTHPLIGSLVPHGDQFLKIAGAMQEEAEKMRAERRPAPVAKGSLIRRLWKWAGREGEEFRGLQNYKRTISGLPRAVGKAPEDRRLQWIVSDAWRNPDGFSSFAVLQSGGERQVKEVRVSRIREAVRVGVTYGVADFQVSQETTVGLQRDSDFQGLSFRLRQKAFDDIALHLFGGAAIVFCHWLVDRLIAGRDQATLLMDGLILEDVDRSTIDRPFRHPIPAGDWSFFRDVDVRRRFSLASARPIRADRLFSATYEPAFELFYSPTDAGAHRSADLSVHFVRTNAGPPFPEPFVDFVRKIAQEIERQIHHHGGEEEILATREFVEDLVRGLGVMQGGPSK
ncbi:MAG TPA: hypothetical protein VLJ37_12030 [bacterium]|nr:hypothetical protein [bacterium]